MNSHQVHYRIFYLMSCFSLTLVHCSTNSSPTCLQDQSTILLQFKQEFAQQDGSKTENWNTDQDCCSWDGVECDGEGRVIGLDLSFGSLRGSLSANSSLFWLTSLRQLSLASNDFNYSAIPPQFGLLSRLTHLSLAQSMFSGQIPYEISRLKSLVSLDLSATIYMDHALLALRKEVLTGLVRNVTNLKELNLNAVDLSSLEAASFGNFSSLETLSLSQCNLNGEFPRGVFLLPNIRTIDASSNDQLTGSLPEFPHRSRLESLAFSLTKFSGTLLPSIGNLKSLKKLDLKSCNFSGTLPNSLGDLSNLTNLVLSSNNFSGKVLSSLGGLAKLEFLSLSGNQFDGEIPSSLGNLNNLTDLQLDHNKFKGGFPVALTNLTNLMSLDISDNQLSGPFPNDAIKILNLKSLYSLDLGHNFFNGTFPSFLFEMPSLLILTADFNQFSGHLNFRNASSFQIAYLNLRRNFLTGEIPSSISNFTSLADLSLGANNFSGRVDFGIFSEMTSLGTLDLSYNNLTITYMDMNSTLPSFTSLGLASCNLLEFPRFLQNQTGLWELDLTKNKIEGDIPKWLFGIAKIRKLYLSTNFITGWEHDEPQILPWNKLEHLDLSNNIFRGSLVVPPQTLLQYFVSDNNLTGEINPVFCALPNLKVLDASNNRMSGEIPRCLPLNTSLTTLNLRGNSFRGHIPPTCNEGSPLKTFDLSRNKLEGNISRSLAKCQELEVLNIGHNQINGEFPFWTQSLPNLQVLILRNNNFRGPIWNPRDFFGFEKLRIIDLSFNSFSGNLPSDYFRNWTAINSEIPRENKLVLKYLGDSDNYYTDSIALASKGVEMNYTRILTTLMAVDLSYNEFRSEVPSSIGELKSLIVLNLSSNNFHGLIPSSVGNLVKLESLDLSNNSLSGEIPQQLVSLTFLSYLKLSENDLRGKVPQGGQFNTFTSSSYEGNKELCGFPLAKKCGNPDEGPRIDDGMESGGTETYFEWKAMVIGLVFGLAIGLIVEHVVALRRPNWLGVYRRILNQ